MTHNENAVGAQLRDYRRVCAAVRDALGRLATPSLEERMGAVADALWERLRDTGVSWVGFYLHDPNNERRLGATAEAPLVLGPHRDKPACSPIGLHGACGTCYTSQRTLIVRDVRELGEAYVACDPRDRSELVLPVFDRGVCVGVLDADSHELASFDEHDAAGFAAALTAAGLAAAPLS